MRKTIFLFLLGLVALHGCKDPCKGIVTYPKLASAMPNYFYKVGSYWVYRDSADGITDSMYVYFTCGGSCDPTTHSARKIPAVS